ncbi:hypothetical protein [Faecalimonas umbilicata]|nr:hypothetical protein [Faecalimonas umbilicata]
MKSAFLEMHFIENADRIEKSEKRKVRMWKNGREETESSGNLWRAIL